jgi:hypothetical protein
MKDLRKVVLNGESINPENAVQLNLPVIVYRTNKGEGDYILKFASEKAFLMFKLKWA